MTGKRPLLWILVITFFAVLWVQWPRLQDPYQIEGDFSVLHWMHRFDDQELFKNDPSFFSRITEIELGSQTIVMDSGSPGFSWLFQIANTTIPFLTFSKLLIFPLTLIAVAYMYGIGKKIGGTETAVVLSLVFLVLNLASSTSVSTTGGLQRSFIFPLLLGLIYHLMNKQFGATAIILIIGGLVYPTVFVLGMATTALTLVDWQSLRQHHLKINWKGGIYLGTAVMIVMLIFTPSIMAQPTPTDDSNQTPGEFYQLFNSGGEGHVLTDPLYQSGSRAQLFTIFPFIGRGGLAVRGISIIHIAILTILAIITILLRPQALSEADPILKYFFVGIWISFTTAWLGIIILSSFPLYLPSRYTEASLFLVLLIFVVTNGKKSFSLFTQLLYEKTQIVVWIIFLLSLFLSIFAFISLISRNQEIPGLRNMYVLLLILSIIMMILALYRKFAPPKLSQSTNLPMPRKLNLIVGGSILAAIGAFYVFSFQSSPRIPDKAERDLYAYIETLPKDTNLSGSPNILSTVSLFGKRQVIYSCAGPNFVPEIIKDSLSAFYADPDDAQRVHNYCNEYDVDYWVVDSRLYKPGTRESLYCSLSPYDSELLPDLIHKNSYYFETISEDSYTFHSDYLFVVPCE